MIDEFGPQDEFEELDNVIEDEVDELINDDVVDGFIAGMGLADFITDDKEQLTKTQKKFDNLAANLIAEPVKNFRKEGQGRGIKDSFEVAVDQYINEINEK